MKYLKIFFLCFSGLLITLNLPWYLFSFSFLCFTLLGLFLSPTSSKVLTFPSPPKDEDILREQLKIIPSAALVTLELVEKQLAENIHLEGTGSLGSCKCCNYKNRLYLEKDFGKTNPNLHKEHCDVKKESWLLDFLLAKAIIAPLVVFNWNCY